MQYNKPAKRSKPVRLSSIEPLESRLLLANIHLTDAYLVDADGNKLTTVAVGNQPFIQVEFTTTGLSAAAHYDVTTATSGRTFTSTITWGAGLGGTGFWIFRSPQYLVRPGLQSVSVTLDSGSDVAETDETDNDHFHLYSGVTFGPGFNKMLEGTPNFDWSIGNYNDVDANYPDDGGFAGPCQDFAGGDYCYDGHNGWDIGVANWREGYRGWDIYAAAAGTVQIANDGNDDHNTEALGQPSNYVQIDHGDGWVTQYHHMAKNTITVVPGQVITQAQINAGFKIGEMGSSGNSTGLHLHFGVYYNGQLVEPMTDKTNYLNFSLAYSPDAPAVLGTGVTNYNPTNELAEGPSDASVFLTNTAGQTVYSWATLAGLQPSDTYGPIWHRPDNSIAFNYGAGFTGASHGGIWYGTFNLPSNATPGTWRVDWVINGVVKRSATFEVQSTGEAQARMYWGSTYIVDGRRSPLDFGTLINSQATAPSMIFTVYNSGQVPLTTSGLSIPAGFFLAGGSSLAGSIAPGGSDSFQVFADVFAPGHHEGYISFLTDDPSPGELVQSFKIEDDVLSASDAINSLVSSATDNIYIRRQLATSNAEIYLNSDTPTWIVPIAQMANLSINTLGGDDSLIVDFDQGSPLNLTGMDYNGSSGTDQFTIWGSDNADAILIGNHQGWWGLSSHVDFTNIENIRAEGRGNDDTITIGGAGALDLDQAGTNITVLGGNGSDDLVLNDQDDVNGGIYTITSTTVDRFAFSLLTYSTFESLTLNANNTDSNISIETSLQATPITVNGDDGDDWLYITPAAAQLEGVKGSVTFNGGAGQDNLVLSDENHAAIETFSINSAAITSTRTGLTPPSFGVSYATIEDAIIHAGIGSSIFNIHGTNAATPLTINAGGGADVFNVTPVGNNLGAIAGALTLNGEAGSDTLNLDDSGFGPPSFTINSFTDTTFTTSHAAAIDYASLEHMTYQNPDDGSLTTIKSLPASLATFYFFGNGGVDNLLVGEAATGLAPLGLGSLIIDTGAANDSITIHDESNLNNDAYTLTSATFDKTSFGTFSYTNDESLTLFAGGGSNSIILTSSTIPIAVYGGGGSDGLTLGSGNLSNIVGPVTFSGDIGFDSVTLNDLAYAFGSTTTITPTTVTRSFFGGLTYSNLERLTLNAQDVASAINVNGTAPNMAINVNPNGGTDNISINETDPTSPVSIGPSTGDDTVNINTDGSGSAGATFTFTTLLGTLNIAGGGRADLTAGGPEKVLRTNNLSITGNGVLNLADHDLIVQATPATRSAVFTQVGQMLTSGRQSSPNLWQGPGIHSGSAAANSSARALGYLLNGAGGTTFASFDSQPVDLSSILVRYTVLGDLNLDKTVSIADFIQLSSHFNLAGSWSDGDINYDHQVTIADFIALSSNFNQTLSGDVQPLAADPPMPAAAEVISNDVIESTTPVQKRAKRVIRRHYHHRHIQKRVTLPWLRLGRQEN